MRKNYSVTSTPIHNHGGSEASKVSPEQALRRAVMSCLLWEDTFYEGGEDIAKRIERLVAQVPMPVAVRIAREASQKMHLRHIPLYMTALIAKNHGGPKGTKGTRTPGSATSMISELVTDVVNRVDAIMELISLVGQVNGLPLKRKSNDHKTKTVRKALSAQIRKGLAKAFLKFDEYQFAKYQQNNSNLAISLKDAYFLVHPGDRNRNAEQRTLYHKIVGWKKDKSWKDGNSIESQQRVSLTPPNTWEVRLAAGENKKDVFTDLLETEKLGYMALLRNLRNMQEAGVDDQLIRNAILKRKGARKVLPFRYAKAVEFAPGYFQELDISFKATVEDMPKLSGRTCVLVDVSSSMDGEKVSKKSDMTRTLAAASLAAIVPSDRLDIFTFSNSCVQVPSIRGLALIPTILKSQYHAGTNLHAAVRQAATGNYDRIIMITDMQATDSGMLPDVANGYLINIGTYANGLKYHKRWVEISGWSENIFAYINEYEGFNQDD